MNKRYLSTVIIAALFSSVAYAFQLTPASKEIHLGQGEEETITIRLVGTKNERVMLYLGDYIIDRRGTVSFSAPDEGDRNSAKDWISPLTSAQEVTYFDTIEQKIVTRSAPVVDLQEGDVKDVSFRISPPADARGEYYATLHFRDITPAEIENPDSPQVAIFFAIAARLSIHITGSFVPVKQGISLDGAVYPGDSNTRLFSAFKNTGNIFLNVKGKTYIRRKKDNRIFAEIDLIPAGSQPDGRAFILPGSIRDFEGFLNRPLPEGEYIAETVYDYGTYIKPKDTVSFTIVSGDDRSDLPAFSFEPKEVTVSSLSGNTVVQKVTIYNMSSEPLSLNVRSEASWIRVLNPDISIPEGSFRNIGIIARIPENPEAGMESSPLVIRQSDGMETEIPVVIGGNGGG